MKSVEIHCSRVLADAIQVQVGGVWTRFSSPGMKNLPWLPLLAGRMKCLAAVGLRYPGVLVVGSRRLLLDLETPPLLESWPWGYVCKASRGLSHSLCENLPGCNLIRGATASLNVQVLPEFWGGGQLLQGLPQGCWGLGGHPRVLPLLGAPL